MRTLPLIALALTACGGSQAPAPEAEPAKEEAKMVEASKEAPAVPASVKAVFKPVTAKPVAEADKAKVDLGRALYYEERMSAGQNQSCNTCHQLDNWGVDNEPTSPGSFGERGARNSPSSYFAYGHIAQFWDGRAPDLAEQAKGPPLNPIEMAIPDEAYAVKVLKSIPGYVEMFKAAYPDAEDPVTYDHFADAIAVFESYLIAPSPFDAWLQGDGSQISPEAAKGAEVFVQTGCTACHMGEFLGGNMYQKLGLVKPYETEDVGRMEATGNEADKYFFKVPSLRNVAKTGPYFHDGSVKTLEQAITLMADHQLGKQLSEEQVAQIKAFLESLTGEIPAEYIKKPEMPGNGDATPGPIKKG